ncbi:MAG TPA: peptidoglycan-binding domain-containing protein [Terriglobia bacterium]|nr:peptidoglycan-binding domain-containing protein [Terriglobia bacterium]
MGRASFAIVVFSCTLLLGPSGLAQHAANAPAISQLTQQQLESVQIELLERGFVPVFSSDPVTDKAQLRKTLAEFQAANNMPATGELDAQTLDALTVPNPKADLSTTQVQRAKPSK